MSKACPHATIAFCPLYHAAHMAGGFSCDDGRMGEGTCAVSRKMSYARAVAKLRAQHPVLVAQLAFAEEAEARQAQRARNMRAAGLH